MRFETSEKVDEWVKMHWKTGCRSCATAGEQFKFMFLPTAIVEIQTVKCLCCKKKFTDYID